MRDNSSNALLRRASSAQRVPSPADMIRPATLLGNPFALLDVVSSTLPPSPFEAMRRMHEEMDHLFAQAFGEDKERLPLLASTTAFVPRVDVSETDNAYCIDMELPGIPQEAIDIRVVEGTLTIRAEANAQKADPQENDQRQYHHRERYFGRFERVFHLPPNANEDTVRAEFKDGVLSVTIGKKDPVPEDRGGRRIAITSSGSDSGTENKAISGVEMQKAEGYVA